MEAILPTAKEEVHELELPKPIDKSSEEQLDIPSSDPISQPPLPHQAF